MFEVKKAKREKLVGAIAIIGPSGSGKTLGALFMAYGIINEKYPNLSEEEKWEKIGLIDTEHKRSLVYADMEKAGIPIKSFLYIDLQAPYTVERYTMAQEALKEAGAEVIINDSISHAWEGDQGLLDLQDKFGGNFQAWAKVNPYYRNFISLVTGEKFGLHTINTIRAKQEYAMVTNDMNKLEVKKLGLKPVQRDSLEYEFQEVFNVGMDHLAQMSKDNGELFEGAPFRITPEVGAKLYKWLEAGVDVQAEAKREREDLVAYVSNLVENHDGVAAIIGELEGKAKKEFTKWDLKLLKTAKEKYIDPILAKETVSESN